MSQTWTESSRRWVCVLALTVLAGCSTGASAQEDPGSVLVVNTTPYTLMNVTVNQGLALDIPAVGPEPGVFPTHRVAAAESPEEGGFGRGDNSFIVSIFGLDHAATITLPPAATYALNRNFTLMVTENVVFILNDSGSVVTQTTLSNISQ